MKRWRYLPLILALAAGGCAAPLVTPRPPTFQEKVEYVSDWSALAGRTARRIASTLHASPPKVFVAPGPVDMPFAVAYRKLLEQALLEQGYPVVENSTDAMVVSFDAQTFLYGQYDRRYPCGYATCLTTAYAIGTQLRHVSSIDTGAAIVAGAGPIVDLLYSLNDTTQAEVLLTITVADATHLHYRDTESFYVQPSDLRFYWTALPDSPPQSMASDSGALKEVALPVVTANRRR